MATLQKIRDRGVLLVAVIGIALLAFILGDLLTSGNTLFASSRDRAFVVNGNVVSTQEYAERITEWEEFQKMISGQSSFDENTSQQIREAVYNQMVREMILDNQAAKLGLTVSKAEINDLVHGESISPLLRQLPFFVDPQTGMFDRDALVQFLSVVNSDTQYSHPEEAMMIQQYKQMWLFIENMVKYQRLEEKFNALLANAVMVNNDEVKMSFDLNAQNADIAYAVKSYFSIADSLVSVTDQEIKSYYDKHKSSFLMDVPMAKISYFTKEVAPNEEDFAEVELEAAEAYDKLVEGGNVASIVADYSDTPFRDIYMSASILTNDQMNFVESASIADVSMPERLDNAYVMHKLLDKKMDADSLHLRMISIPDASVMGQDSVVAHFVDSIRNEITDAATFAEVAFSLNPQSNGGDVGWVREIDLAQVGNDVVKSAFAAKVGEPFLVKVPGQQMILLVEEKTAPVQKYKIATIAMPVVVSEKTSNNIDNELNQLVSEPEISKKFNELASEKGYFVIPNAPVSANDFSIMQLQGSRQVVTWAVNEKKPGAVKKFDLPNMRVVARVDQIHPAGVAPLSELSSTIKNQLINEKKAAMLIDQFSGEKAGSLTLMAEKLDAVVDTVKYVNFTTQNISGLGFEPAINAVSSYASKGEVVGPLKGNMGVYVASVVDRTSADIEEGDQDSQKEMMQQENAYILQMQLMSNLEKKMKVEDNRYVFFR